VLIAILRRSRLAARLYDQPNERSLHSEPTPRVGGIAVMLAALPMAAYFGDDVIRLVVACAAFLSLVSLADDVRSLPIQVRLPAHAAAAGITVLAIAAPAGAPSALWAVEAAVTVVALVWMTNLYNFMDGSDGLAGGMTSIGFAALATGAAVAGQPALALASLAIASASVGFLAHNFPPARVFLGDCGSVPLGFLAGALGLIGTITNAWPLWFPLLVFSPFIADASVTLLRRIVRGERFWRAHRQHAYQRLVLAGWTRGRLAWNAYFLMGAVTASALAGRAAGPLFQLGIILGWAAIYLLLFIAIERHVKAATQPVEAIGR
jgi:UDP-GlcNAc:undecaprenyl-phosphate GlcNAc-1-phosphate transferase